MHETCLGFVNAWTVGITWHIDKQLITSMHKGIGRNRASKVTDLFCRILLLVIYDFFFDRSISFSLNAETLMGAIFRATSLEHLQCRASRCTMADHEIEVQSAVESHRYQRESSAVRPTVLPQILRDDDSDCHSVCL
jgi:hypothetical protein